MKKIVKKWWFWLLIIILLVIGLAVFNGLNNKSKVVYVTEKASIQDLRQTVEVTGQVESADDIDLNFISPGTLREINVKVGDEVKANQVLASLSAADIGAQVNNARAALDVAKSNLDQLLAGASTQDIAVTEKELANANTTYQAALDTLANLEKTRDEEMSNLKTTAVNILNDKSFIAKYSLDVIYDAILDPEADASFYVSNVVLLRTTKDKYQSALLAYQNSLPLINQAKTSNDQEDILAALDTFGQATQAVSDDLILTFNVMTTAIVNSVYTSTVIDNFKSSLSTQSTAINTALSAIQTAASNIRTRDLYYKSQIIAANNDVKSALDSLNLVQARLDLKKAPPRDFEIEAARARVRQAEATLAGYLSTLSDKSIKAPVDGLITKVNYAKGEQTMSTKAVISMIGLSTLQIEVDVPESDITKLKVADEVNIDINAFTDGTKFKGTVTFIDPAATVINEVIYYKVKVSFNEKDDRIKSGMTADLTILTASKPQVLVVPSRAVISRDDQRYVQVLVDGQPIDKEVSIGLKGDNSLIEITSGLGDGEEVIVSAKTNGEK